MIATPARLTMDPTTAATPSPAIETMPEGVVLEYQPAREGLGKRAVSGGLWTVSGYALTQFIRFASSLIMTRLLAKDLFGIMVIVSAVMTGVRLFSDVGLGPSLIANPRGEDEPFLRTAFTVQVVRGFAIWLVTVALAVPVAHYYASRDLQYLALSVVLPVAGFVAVSEGFRSTAVFRIQRHLQFAKQQILDLIEIIVTVAGMIVWAAISKSVWALVVPPLIGSFCATAASHFLMRDRVDRLGWNRTCASELLRIGRWIFLSTSLLFLAGQAASLVFGKIAATDVMGVYNIAASLAIIPITAVMKVGQSVLFPAFARLANDPAHFVGVFYRSRTVLMTLGAMIVSGMIAAGPFAVHALYNPSFADAGWMLQLLALGVWFQIVDATNVAGLLAKEHPNWMAAGNATKVVFMFTLVPLAYHFGYGFGGALVALAIADALRAIASCWGLVRLKIADAGTLLPDLVLPIASAVVGWIALKAAELPLSRFDTMIGGGVKLHRVLVNGSCCMVAGCIVLAVWLPLCGWQWRVAKRQRA